MDGSRLYLLDMTKLPRRKLELAAREVSGLTEELRPEDGAVKSLHGRLGRSVAWVVIVTGVCSKSLKLLGMLSLSVYPSSEGLGYVLGIDAAPEATRP